MDIIMQIVVSMEDLMDTIMHIAGGGGNSEYIPVGCDTAHRLRHGHEPKKGGLKNGCNSEKGVLRTGLAKKRILVTDVAQKGVIGSLFINYLYFFLVNMINW